MPVVPTIPLRTSAEMPQLGLGVFLVAPEDVAASVSAALASGARLVDTAASYGNEAAVGAALADSDIPRADLFVTTKLWNSDHGYGEALRAFEASRARLRLEFLDLYLIHWPLPMRGSFPQTWRALERLHADGLARAIGVSNFTVQHLERLQETASVLPAVNQVELHPGLPQRDLRSFHEQHGIVTQAWGSLGQGKGLLDRPQVRAIARAHGRPPAQIILRWHVQSGIAALFKSVSAERIRENLEIFGFRLTEADMAVLDTLGSGHERLGPDPETFSVV